MTVALRGAGSSRASSPKKSPGPECVHHGAAAVHPGGAVDQDEQLLTGIALAHQVVADADAPKGRLGIQGLELGPAALREQRHAGEQVEVLATPAD
ncbi:hypothetical protein [Sporichthya sp.]|uniref:hypothetical protein n=1 Tax=Sporichthya sp. TaxID=65475 RepID=UPI001823C139|nr:hypothetical protein [Sporichthya sp.]MBA3744866.1 hypothetical protein [Sporichthya sp.]